ncbi:MAG: carbohydrate kinase family protein [Candidatus Helarchaeota archaeon]
MKVDIISIGGVNIDLCAVISEFPHIDEEVEISNLDSLPGGSAANYITGVARLGVSAGFIGKIGDDKYGNELIKAFQEEKVDISHLLIEKGVSSGICLIPIDRQGRRIIFSYRGANARLKPSEIDLNYVSQASLIHITSPPQEVAEFIAKFAKKQDVKISYDPGGKIIRKGLSFIEPILFNTDIFFPSKIEVALLLPQISDLEFAAQFFIKKYGISTVVIKLGGNGCLLASPNRVNVINGFKVKVVDTTGAGDAFAAAFTVGIHRGWDLEKCAVFANAAGALTVTRVGARTALATQEEIDTFLITHRRKK